MSREEQERIERLEGTLKLLVEEMRDGLPEREARLVGDEEFTLRRMHYVCKEFCCWMDEKEKLHERRMLCDGAEGLLEEG